MTASISQPGSLDPAGLARRACGLGFAVAAGIAAVALASGLLPAGTAVFVAAGFGWGAIAAAAGAALQTYGSTFPPGHPALTQRYLLGMVGAFLLQMAAITVGCLLLILLETKFEQLAAFGLSFAVTATALHTVAMVVVSRALHARDRARSAGDMAASSEDLTPR